MRTYDAVNIASTLMYFSISKLLLDGCSHCLQILHGFTDHADECQHLNSFYLNSTRIYPSGSQISIVIIIMKEVFIYVGLFTIYMTSQNMISWFCN